MAKHFVADMLNRGIDRSIQVHGAFAYSADTPLVQRVPARPLSPLRRRPRRGHRGIAQRTIAAHKDTCSTRTDTGDLPL